MSCKQSIALASLLLSASFAGGCATTGAATGSVDETIQSKLGPYNGPRARIRLAEFRWEGPSGSSGSIKVKGPEGEYEISVVEAQEQVATGLQEMLKLALFKTNRFYVLGREESFSGMKDEYGEAQDGWIEEGDEIEKGQVVGPDLIVNAKITKWAPDASGRNIGLGGIAPGILGGLSFGKKKSEVGLIVEVYDIRNQILLASVPVKGAASKSSMGFGGIGWGAGGAAGGVMSSYANTPMEDAIAQAITAAADGLALQIPQSYFRHS